MLNPEGLEVGPHYLAVSATLQASGEVKYNILSIERPATALITQMAGYAAPLCGHYRCRMANLAQAAMDWVYVTQEDHGAGPLHGEMLSFGAER